MQYVKKLISALRNANYGTLKVWINRIRNNAGILQILMIFYLFIESANWHWWYIPFLIVFALISIYDNDKGLSQEIEYMNKKNKMFYEMYNKIVKDDETK